MNVKDNTNSRRLSKIQKSTIKVDEASLVKNILKLTQYRRVIAIHIVKCHNEEEMKDLISAYTYANQGLIDLLNL
jgi:hypothetical protein